MSRALLTVEGFLAKTPELGRTNSGDSYLNLSVPHTPRRKNRDTGQWEDAGDTVWVTFTLWREDAELYAPLVHKGTLLRVEGEPSIRTYDRNGQTGVNLDIRFPRVAIIPRPQATQQGQAAPAGSSVADEPWSTPTGAQTDAWGGETYGEPPF